MMAMNIDQPLRRFTRFWASAARTRCDILERNWSWKIEGLVVSSPDASPPMQHFGTVVLHQSWKIGERTSLQLALIHHSSGALYQSPFVSFISR